MLTEAERCRAAMVKPGPIEALRLLASGRVTIVVRNNKIYVDTFDGRIVRDPDHPECMMELAGSWPFVPAGIVDQFGCITPAGRAALAEEKP